jgi:hypothetical protein
LVIEMNAEARKAAFAEARAESCEILERTADVTVENRDHGAEYWERPKPKPAARNVINDHVLTDAETLRWEQYINGRISAANSARDEFWRDVLGGLISEVRKQLRSEIVEQVGSLRADVEIATKAAARGHDRVIDLPALPLRSQRRA